jgi:Protein of unknown function (DUF4031)
MSVYVDNMRAPYGRLIMCHMIADSTKELLEMADAIGVERKHIQWPGKQNEHFDVCLAMRKRAVERGAIEITLRELSLKLRARRGK